MEVSKKLLDARGPLGVIYILLVLLFDRIHVSAQSLTSQS